MTTSHHGHDHEDRDDGPLAKLPVPDDVQNAIRTLIRWSGDDPEREGLFDTPARVARAWKEYCRGYSEDPAAHLARVFHEVGGYDEVVLLKDIPFQSHCEHHMAPLIGKASIAYLPRDHVVGISKLARVLHGYASRLQIQERLTAEVAQCIWDHLKPQGVAVVIEEGAEVRSGSRLEGPTYVGGGTRVLGGFIRTSVFGPECRVRGEIASTVFLGYGNKAHDGFVGHSVVGHWVNLGAGTTTSNLKSTYGAVRLEVGGVRIETGRSNLGSLFGDHAKTAIGTMLATGTVIGAGANVFGAPTPPKHVPDFAWGCAGERVSEDGFLTVARRVLARREVAW